jgi:hypothetical protein
MPARRDLPTRPNIEQLKKQAKDLLRSHQAGDPECVPRLRAHVHTRPSWSKAKVLAAKFSLLDAQLVVAREYGFDSWHGLALHVAQALGEAASPRSTRRANPGTSKTYPDTLFLGTVYVGALVEASVAHIVNAEATRVDACVDVPEFVETLSVDTHRRQSQQRGEHVSGVVTTLRLDTTTVGTHIGSIQMRASVGVTDVPVELTVLHRDARRQRVLFAETPFHAYGDGAEGLAAFHQVLRALDLDVSYSLDLPQTSRTTMSYSSAAVPCSACKTLTWNRSMSFLPAAGGWSWQRISSWPGRSARPI